jgi:PIN domain nuclease of toxin-antitoxin system
LILLDTHAWVWLAMDPKRLSRAALAAMRRSIESGGICVASIGLWQLAALYDQGRIRAPGTIESSNAGWSRRPEWWSTRSPPRSLHWLPRFPTTSRPIPQTA